MMVLMLLLLLLPVALLVRLLLLRRGEGSFQPLPPLGRQQFWNDFVVKKALKNNLMRPHRLWT
jgi:hypothetical protein